ncbi:uncharacterized protein EI97DRAFT_429746 [Westerdykella ornata]|uniref:F-box domain-containing protein n=1 Tax=Westerdykella ornata TaxID=318751 RepID=A0A6A6JY88_WESOR|nr:uncharacterized protein EI97DRAFT_429746 [Westerdykella ornata]KAF2279989.1 hypothetical protein EI97DRAFT_429746 [Westerdykella ornata]
MANLTSIPLELLLKISSHLSTVDLGSLRRTCRTIERSLFDSFAKEFFSKRQFMLTRPSLQALVDISKHPNLSKELRHVIIGLEKYRGGLQPTFDFPDDSAYKKYQDGFIDQTVFLDLGLARDFLSEAFKNLPNLETVGIRNYSARGRWREGPDALWRSYGAPTVYQETGKNLPPDLGHNEGWDLHRLALTNLVYALGVASSKPPNLEIIFRGRDVYSPDNIFCFSRVLLDGMDATLKGFRSVILPPLYLRDPGWLPSRWTRLAEEPALVTFLARINNITHLRLNFHSRAMHERIAGLLMWLALPAPSCESGTSGDSAQASLTNNVMRPVGFPHLKRLDLGMLRVRGDHILRVIAKFAPTLQELNLWKIRLGEPNDPNSAKKNVWSIFFQSLSKLSGLKLNHLLAGELSQNYYQEALVGFRVARRNGNEEDLGEEDIGDSEDEPEGEETGKFERVVDYRFRDPAFLERLGKRVIVRWPPPPPLPESNAEDDEDEMGNEDDMENEDDMDIDEE